MVGTGVKHGITGNMYAYSEKRDIIMRICLEIGKSPNSIYFNKDYDMWAIRVKSKAHKKKLKEIKYSDDKDLHRRITGRGFRME
jgi:hypothetical protein